MGHQLNYTSHDAHHLNHCIESLRMSVMCHSDISTHTWLYDRSEMLPKATLHIQHTCRDFEAIRKWAGERAIVEDVDIEWQRGAESDFTFEGGTINR